MSHSKKGKNQGGGRVRELFSNSGDLGEVSGFPLGTCGPAHHLCARPRFPSLFLSPKPPLTYWIMLFWARSMGARAPVACRAPVAI